MSGPVRAGRRARVALVAVVCALVAVTPGSLHAQTQAVRVTSDELQATVAGAPEGRVSDQQIRMIDAGGMNLGVGVVHRPVTTTLSAIVHHREAEIYRVVEGHGVLVTSGELAGATELDADGAVVRTLTGPSAMGTIEGGTREPIGPGDVVFIPAGVAHGFSEITEAITYIVYRIDPDQLVELKER